MPSVGDRLNVSPEEYFSAFVEKSADGIFISTVDGRCVEVNASAYRLLGYEPGQLAGKNLGDLLPARDHGALLDVLGRVQKGEVVAREWTLLMRDGSPLVAQCSVQRLADELVIAVVHDTGPRQAFERKILESEARLRSILETAPDVVMTVDREGKILFINRTTTPQRLDQVLGTSCFDYVIPESRARVSAALERVFNKREIDEYEVLGPVATSGEREWSSVRAGPLIEGDRVVAATLCATNVTRRKKSEEVKARLEDQLRQSQKVESIGRLAGGVAHDFNNLMTSTLGFLELALAAVPKESEVAAFLEGAVESTKRGAALTQQLLAYARKKIVRPELVVLNAVLERMAPMVRRLVGEDLEVVLELGRSLGTVKVDVGSVEQVVMNLVVNARDAIAGAGRITLETRNVHLDTRYCHEHAEVTPGEYVMLGVTDTGSGMSPDVAARIFDPFFTTKPVGEGTGLGLATCDGIVRQAGGSIAVQTEPGRGTTFRVYLPRSFEVPTPVSTRAPLPPTPGGRETLLVVEDEPMILRVARRALAALGYQVLTASDGPEALEVAARTPEPIHLLITDVVMPKMGGRELAAKLTALRPEMRVLYSSGYTADEIQRGVLAEGIHFIQKPYSQSSLAAQVRELLDKG